MRLAGHVALIGAEELLRGLVGRHDGKNRLEDRCEDNIQMGFQDVGC